LEYLNLMMRLCL